MAKEKIEALSYEKADANRPSIEYAIDWDEARITRWVNCLKKDCITIRIGHINFKLLGVPKNMIRGLPKD